MKQSRRSEFASTLLGLSDKSVEVRNNWRSVAGAAVWFLLSGMTMIPALFGVEDRLHKAVVIGMSLVKYVPLLLVVYSLARRKAALYLDDIYELHDEEMAYDFIEEVTFGRGHERITIKEGRITENDEKSSLILIGGPGSIQVNLDSVALLEKVDGEPKVIFPRNEPWRLDRFERIREIGKLDEIGKREYAIINLRDQFLSNLVVKSRTKDGIPLEAHGIKVMFSLLQKGHVRDDHIQRPAYLFDEEAVKSLVYDQIIISPSQPNKLGVPFPWDTTVVPLITSELEKLITSRPLSEILASISQKEMDSIAQNEQTIAQMKVEMTGQHAAADPQGSAPASANSAVNFESRSKITAQFFTKEFKEKAAKIGVSIQWIDIGTWQLPNTLIIDKHKEAWNLSHENEKKRGAIKSSGRRFEIKEIINLVNHVVIDIYEKSSAPRFGSSKEKELSIKELEKELEGLESVVSFGPELKKQSSHQESGKKNSNAIAREMLKAFGRELKAGRSKIREDSRPPEDKQEELAAIEKALHNISLLIPHYVKPS